MLGEKDNLMNIIFLSLDDYKSVNERGTYTDVLREFIRQGHYVCAVSPTSNANSQRIIHETELCDILKPLIVNSQKVSFIQKGLSIATISARIKYEIKRCGILNHKEFNLILYATPPVTIAPVVEFLKKTNKKASAFLLLKDMWPQVAIDVGMLQERGIKGVLSKVLRTYESRMYKVSDLIGCMSPANQEYVSKHHPEISSEKILVCPNSMEPFDPPNSKTNLRVKYNINPKDIVFLYGGNIGKMQGIPFLCECLTATERYKNGKFVICGKGTEYAFLQDYITENRLQNTVLINGLPREEFEELTRECDYGMVYLDWRATTPNFPSRILPYMNNSKPIIACTDNVTDIGDIIMENGFGWKVPSNDVEAFKMVLNQAINNPLYDAMCEQSHKYLLTHYTAKETVRIITESISNSSKKV